MASNHPCYPSECTLLINKSKVLPPIDVSGLSLADCCDDLAVSMANPEAREVVMQRTCSDFVTNLFERRRRSDSLHVPHVLPHPPFYSGSLRCGPGSLYEMYADKSKYESLAQVSELRRATDTIRTRDSRDPEKSYVSSRSTGSRAEGASKPDCGFFVLLDLDSPKDSEFSELVVLVRLLIKFKLLTPFLKQQIRDLLLSSSTDEAREILNRMDCAYETALARKRQEVVLQAMFGLSTSFDLCGNVLSVAWLNMEYTRLFHYPVSENGERIVAVEVPADVLQSTEGDVMTIGAFAAMENAFSNCANKLSSGADWSTPDPVGRARFLAMLHTAAFFLLCSRSDLQQALSPQHVLDTSIRLNANVTAVAGAYEQKKEADTRASYFIRKGRKVALEAVAYVKVNHSGPSNVDSADQLAEIPAADVDLQDNLQQSRSASPLTPLPEDANIETRNPPRSSPLSPLPEEDDVEMYRSSPAGIPLDLWSVASSSDSQDAELDRLDRRDDGAIELEWDNHTLGLPIEGVNIATSSTSVPEMQPSVGGRDQNDALRSRVFTWNARVKLDASSLKDPSFRDEAPEIDLACEAESVDDADEMSDDEDDEQVDWQDLVQAMSAASLLVRIVSPETMDQLLRPSIEIVRASSPPNHHANRESEGETEFEITTMGKPKDASSGLRSGDSTPSDKSSKGSDPDDLLPQTPAGPLVGDRRAEPAVELLNATPLLNLRGIIPVTPPTWTSTPANASETTHDDDSASTSIK